MAVAFVRRSCLSLRFSYVPTLPVNHRLSLFKCSYKSYHRSNVLHASDVVRPPDYGKYSEPSNFESLLETFADTSLVQGTEHFLISTQELTGLPWWTTIVLCTVTLRTVITFPLFVWQAQKMAKYQMVAPVLKVITERLSKEGDEEAKKLNWDRKTRDMHVVNSFWKHKKKLMKDHKIPGTFRRYLLPWVQLPIWFSMSTAIRHLTLSFPLVGPIPPVLWTTYNNLSTGGAFWFSDLCAADATLILPILAGVTNLAIIEVHRGDGKQPLTHGMKVLINFVRLLSVAMIPIGSYMPAAVVLYWVSSSSFGLAQALAMQSVRVKKLLRIPVPTNHSKSPYRDIMSRFKFRRQ